MNQSFLIKLITSLTILPLLIATVAQAQSQKVTSEDFVGFWEIQEPAGDTCIVIIKRGNRVSCFWSGTAKSQILQGSWELVDEKLVAKWETGYIDVFEKLGTNAISRSSFAGADSTRSNPLSTVRGVRVDNRIPGSLTTNSGEFVPRERDEIAATTNTPAIPIQNPYTGYWKMKQSTGIFGIGGASSEFFYLNLDRNGSARVALRNWDGSDSTSGKWRYENNKALIEWDTGNKDMISEGPNGSYTFSAFAKKKSFSDKPNDVRDASKVSAPEAQQFFTAGNSQQLTVTDIRGTWTYRTPGDNPDYIEIEGWGNAYRSPSKVSNQGTDPGKWRMNNDRVIITWVDGSKDVIRLAFPNFVRESYAPGEPTTGTPFKTVEVVRVDKTR